MNLSMPNKLCGLGGCRRMRYHSGPHNSYPTNVWGFLSDKDKKKLAKSGFATPRGGEKGAYQNHVTRNNKVIVPFERLKGIDLRHFRDGYVVRVYADQYFSSKHVVRLEIALSGIEVGQNAFVLYRTHDQYRDFPPPPDWQVRHLELNGVPVIRRGEGVLDKGHYVLRIAGHGIRGEIVEGPPQGIFAPEYCDEESNFLSKCLLAWLITRTIDSHYLAVQGEWLEAILLSEEAFDMIRFEKRGLTRNGFTNCPLCLRQVRYSELHDTILFPRRTHF